ncbi:YraN family protein [Tropicimonas sp. IMCC34043]|uniref:YraN family protein n=1 Tax=Tropicimonas sp. IMCC34043 TaxID=2248760 RepID=UPI000E27EBBD|nr:YraN family protein [Tropicimonas sp. IMCC34043]
MSGSVSYHGGLRAEEIVERHYARNGHPVSDRRWRGASGEIDLVVQDGDGLVFVEVKKSRDFARAAERLTLRQMRRICGAASEYLGRMPLGQLTIVRFDVALVDSVGRIEVLENAFGA